MGASLERAKSTHLSADLGRSYAASPLIKNEWH
jgi:hypothetical protein